MNDSTTLHNGGTATSTDLAHYDKLAVQRLARCIKELRELNSEIQAQAVHLLLEIAIQPDITMSQLCVKTRLSQASCSRNVSLLSLNARHDRPGLGLVKAEEDPRERRRKIVRLTPKGEELIASLADIVR